MEAKASAGAVQLGLWKLHGSKVWGYRCTNIRRKLIISNLRVSFLKSTGLSMLCDPVNNHYNNNLVTPWKRRRWLRLSGRAAIQLLISESRCSHCKWSTAAHSQCQVAACSMFLKLKAVNTTKYGSMCMILWHGYKRRPGKEEEWMCL